MVVVVIAATLLAGMRRAVASETRDAFHWTAHTLEVEKDLQATVAALERAESAQRGFLLLGDTAYLAPMVPASESARRLLHRLRRLTLDNATQQRRLDTLGRLLEARLTLLSVNVALARAGKRDSVDRVLRTGRGRLLTDSIYATVRRGIAHEDSLLVRREAAVEAALARQALAEELILGLVVLAIALTAAILYWLRRAEQLVTMCAWSKTIQYEGQWMSIEAYMERRFGLSITHGISPAELERMDAEMEDNSGTDAA